MAHNMPNSKRFPNSRSCRRKITEHSLRLANSMSNHTGLSHITTSAGRAFNVIIPMIAALLLLAAAPRDGWGQTAPDSIVYDGSTTSSPCGDECCQEFTITITQPTDNINIQVGRADDSSPPDCLDHTCWSNQSTATETFEEGPPPSWMNFRIAASTADIMWTGPFPFSFNVYICGAYSCFQQYDEFTWSTEPPWHAEGTIPLYESACQPIPPCTSGCSYITVVPEGVAYAYPVCGTDVCFYNQSGATISSFVLNFDPPLNPNNTCGVSGPTICSGGPYVPNVNSMQVISPSFMHITGYDPMTGNVTISGVSAGLDNCSSCCIYVPRCAVDENPGNRETITLVSPANPPTCDPSNSTITANMKEVDGSLSPAATNGAAQNYPNPLSAASGFNTTIPFATSAGGVASITIADAKGVKVLSDDEEILGAGSHFFYFSAKDLPSGTYYYTIEFPQGVIIASKTMLVVK